MRRISEAERSTAAERIRARLAGAPMLPQIEREKLFADVVTSEAQRVLVLIRSVADNCRKRASEPMQRAMAAHLGKACESDPTSANGLTAEATRSLALACAALARRMNEEHEAGSLSQNRMEMLIGGGEGMHTVGTALLESFVESFLDR